MRDPDFFLIGAQKAGTTTLAAMLDTVPGVSVSRPKEPMLFCFDDYAVHQNEFLHPGRNWTGYRWKRDREELLARYRSCFAHAEEGDTLGEASTTYAPSQVACERIAETCPGARIIMILRDPVKRAFSAYWHGIRAGVFTRRFEEEIRFGNGILLRFGHYEEQLRRFMGEFGRDRVLVLHFEDLLGDPQPVLAKLLRFLDIACDPSSLPELPRLNESFYPRWPGLHCRLSGVLRRLADHTPRSTLAFLNENEGPESGSAESGVSPAVPSWVKRAYRWSTMTGKVPHPMAPETRELLVEHFSRANDGLPALLGENVFRRWSWEGPSA